jgi:hypothetical protein
MLIHAFSTAIHTLCTGEKTPKHPWPTPNPTPDNTQSPNALLWKN